MSDQDFFFDEEDEKPARSEKASPSTPSGGKAAAPKAPAAKADAPTASAGMFFERDLNMGIASLLVVIALLLGVLVGVLVGESRANNALLSVPTSADTNSGAGGSAPPLSQDQLNSGDLPAGHPSVGATGSTNATGK